jgi:hypothetical protein
MLGEHSGGGRRDSCLKMGWTERTGVVDELARQPVGKRFFHENKGCSLSRSHPFLLVNPY